MAKKEYPGTDNPLLDEILQKYRDCSTDSISGPKALTESRGGRYWRYEHDTAKHIVTSSQCSRNRISNVFARKMPPKERSGLKFKETLIDNIPMACFSYGGEKRLCYNQLLNDVLKDFNPSTVSETRDRLRVYCPRTTPQQLEIFKLAGVRSWSCSSASLITKSDCFRLIGAIVGSRVPRRPSRIFSVDSFEVYHECFGGCVGTLEVELYLEPYAKCITCAQCDGVFAPQKFVTHNHSSGEPHTCHWGFDNAKWRLYLMLCNENPNQKLQRMWEMLMRKFSDCTQRKRSSEEMALADHMSARSSGSPEKKSRLLNGTDRVDGRRSLSPRHTPIKSPTQKDLITTGHLVATVKTEPGTGADIMSRRSAFRPWSPTGDRSKSAGRASSDSSAGSTPTPSSTPTHPHGFQMLVPSVSRSGPATTVHYMSTERSCGNRPPAQYKSFVEQEDGDVISTPNSTDPRSLEKTAKDMLEVVAQNDRWATFESTQNEGNLADKPVALFSEEHIYQTLIGYTQNDSLPSLKELSVSLAKDFKDVLAQRETVIRDLLESRNKLHARLDSLKREHADKLEEVYDELKNTRKELRRSRVLNREELEEKNECIRLLEKEVKQLSAVRDELLSRNSDPKDSIEVMQQEVRDIANKLDDREKYCIELQTELKALHAWISTQRRYDHDLSSPLILQTHNLCGPRRDSESVIRNVHLINGKNHHSPGRNDSALVKTNGVVHHDSSDDEN